MVPAGCCSLYNQGVARGWESKDVESQQDLAEANRAALLEQKVTEEQVERQKKIDSLELSRTRVMHDIQAACNPRYKTVLFQALAHLDAELAKLR
jgi:hypothetical protein